MKTEIVEVTFRYKIEYANAQSRREAITRCCQYSDMQSMSFDDGMRWSTQCIGVAGVPRVRKRSRAVEE